jgi:hypothetical protein
MSPKNNYDDEALARALQIEYEREYRRRSMQQHLDVNEIGPSTRGSSTRNTSHVPAVTPLPPPPMGIPSAPLSNSFYEDDFDGNETLNNVVGSHRGIPATVQPSFPRSSFIMAEDRFGNVEFSDEEHARKLEQDMIDEERRRKQRKQHLQQQRDSYRATSSMNRGSNNVNTVSDAIMFRVPVPVLTFSATINQSSIVNLAICDHLTAQTHNCNNIFSF